jgi:hypothetical protein
MVTDLKKTDVELLTALKDRYSTSKYSNTTPRVRLADTLGSYNNGNFATAYGSFSAFRLAAKLRGWGNIDGRTGFSLEEIDSLQISMELDKRLSSKI